MSKFIINFRIGTGLSKVVLADGIYDEVGGKLNIKYYDINTKIHKELAISSSVTSTLKEEGFVRLDANGADIAFIRKADGNTFKFIYNDTPYYLRVCGDLINPPKNTTLQIHSYVTFEEINSDDLFIEGKLAADGGVILINGLVVKIYDLEYELSFTNNIKYTATEHKMLKKSIMEINMFINKNNEVSSSNKLQKKLNKVTKTLNKWLSDVDNGSKDK